MSTTTATHPLYALLLAALNNDLTQMVEEGHDEQALTHELELAQSRTTLDALAALQAAWWQRPSPAAYGYDEPDDWDAIKALVPAATLTARTPCSDALIADRVLAGWQGRCAGCQLGKPLEGTTWPDKIRTVLELVGSWPLDDYMNPTPPGISIEELPDCDFFKRGNDWRNTLCKGNFDHVAPDDDIHYTLTSQIVLEKHGPHFSPQDLLKEFLAVTPLSCLWASGRNMFRTAVFGMAPPHTALFGNPCRQSLGGMIRCDAWGWGAPGNPALAAWMAWKDAHCSQTRNGIYAAMFFAALIADVIAHGDLPRALATAAQFVPPRSRFAEMLRLVQDWCAHLPDWQAVNCAILDRWPAESKRFNHAIPNAAIVLTGLLMGGGDFSRTLGVTVMCGLDTDCTGATAGSIFGCTHGTRAIPARWITPFHDTIRTDLKGMPHLTISGVARRMAAVAQRCAQTAI